MPHLTEMLGAWPVDIAAAKYGDIGAPQPFCRRISAYINPFSAVMIRGKFILIF
jgi:hypothetical protein